MTAAIEMKSVTKRFGDRLVLDKFDMAVASGSIFALLGDNGTGKSTTMKILTGQVRADSGEARLLGRDAWVDAIALRHRVGYVPEKPKFYDWMTVAELGRFIGGFHQPGFLKRYYEASERLGLDTSRKLTDLSKGGYARAGLALALAIDPQVLLLDEPTSGLDLSTRREFLSGMVDLAAEGRTILITSHQIAEVERIASHVGLMVGGKLVMCQTLDELKSNIVRLVVQGNSEELPLPGLGTVLQSERFGNIWRGVVHHPDLTLMEQFAAERDTISFQFERLSLEEIYSSVIAFYGVKAAEIVNGGAR
ncbi:MAG: ABC transporter ATP-binding protein [Planctomycetota bacterium]|nr:MAG: ABC transporter ATP-binding protein [Planctomycetota bacterium]